MSMSAYTTGMTLEQQIGQVFMFGFPGPAPSQDVLNLIERYHLGNIILFSRNIQDARQLLSLTRTLQDAARAAHQPAPLLIATDQENGVVRRLGPDSTIFPGNMALGAIGSEQMARDVARATGEELCALGINMNFAPVVDVNNNPANPVIGTRSFGEDPHLVARLGVAAVQGYAAARVVSTLKHFPGHGDTAVDSHRALPAIPASLDRLGAVELVPFRAGIAAGADAVMIGHIALPALGETLPATISPAIIGGLLREQLGFAGVVVTDCLEMDAIVSTVGVARGAVMALQAGADLVLVSHLYDRQLSALEAVRAAVTSGALSRARIQEAAERVLALKAAHLTWDRLPDERGLAVVGSADHVRLSETAYAQSTTVMRDDGRLIPLRLRPEQSVLVVVCSTHAQTKAADGLYSEALITDAVRAFHPNVHTLALNAESAGELPRAVDAVSCADVTVLVTMNAHLDPAQRAALHQLAAAGRTTLAIAASDPYDADVLPEVKTYLATYEYNAPALQVAARVLFGQSQAVARAPVSLAMAD
jgi:beta-N-acetylhexosaminidase